MGDVIFFPRWRLLDDPIITAQPHEINCIVVYDFLDWALPIPDQLSIFERKWLQQIKGYRNHESFEYLEETRDSWDARIAMKLYGSCELPKKIRRSEDGGYLYG
jgi:hypothetical protein